MDSSEEKKQTRAFRAMPAISSSLPSSAEEVVIRTMASDISAMGSEGEVPTGEVVRLKSTATTKKEKAKVEPEKPADNPLVTEKTEDKGGANKGSLKSRKKIMKVGMYVIVAVVAMAGLFSAGYFIYPLFTGGEPGPDTGLPDDRKPPVGDDNVNGGDDTETSIHRSLFRLPPQAALSLSLTDGLDLTEVLPGLVANVLIDTDIFEVLVEMRSESVEWNEFLNAIGSEIPSEVFGQNFDQDFTMFVERGSEGAIRTGYILAPLPGKIQVLLQRDLVRLEGLLPELVPLFASDPGSPEGTFRDGLIAGYPVRRSNFTATNAEFIYGWVEGRLLIATSESAWRKAAALL